MPTIKFTDENDVERQIPAKFEVCPDCRGNGSRVNPAIDGDGISADEMHELGDDFQDDYRSGVYNIPCDACSGKRVVEVIDEMRAKPEDAEAYFGYLNAMHEDRALQAAEMRAGA